VRWGLTRDTYSRRPQPYLTEVRWLRVETGRREGLDRPSRTCPHCSLGAVEDEHHMVFDCPKYARLRSDYSESLLGVG
jgi:hypothetical protein